MDDKDRALDAVTQRIEDLRSAKNTDFLSSGHLRFMGYLEALEDQGLLSEKEVRELNAEADKASDARLAELHPPRDK